MRQRKHGRAGDCEFSGVSPAIDTALGKHIPTWKEQVFKLASGRIQERHSRGRVHPGTLQNYLDNSNRYTLHWRRPSPS